MSQQRKEERQGQERKEAFDLGARVGFLEERVNALEMNLTRINDQVFRLLQAKEERNNGLKNFFRRYFTA